jgi:hypothetical protein
MMSYLLNLWHTATLMDLYWYLYEPISWAIMFMGFYILYECFYGAIHIHNGGRVCQFMKYLASFIVGLLTITYVLCEIYISPRYGFAVLAIAMFFWPNTYYRYFAPHDRRAFEVPA